MKFFDVIFSKKLFVQIFFGTLLIFLTMFLTIFFTKFMTDFSIFLTIFYLLNIASFRIGVLSIFLTPEQKEQAKWQVMTIEWSKWHSWVIKFHLGQSPVGLITRVTLMWRVCVCEINTGCCTPLCFAQNDDVISGNQRNWLYTKKTKKNPILCLVQCVCLFLRKNNTFQDHN